MSIVRSIMVVYVYQELTDKSAVLIEESSELHLTEGDSEFCHLVFICTMSMTGPGLTLPKIVLHTEGLKQNTEKPLGAI